MYGLEEIKAMNEAATEAATPKRDLARETIADIASFPLEAEIDTASRKKFAASLSGLVMLARVTEAVLNGDLPESEHDAAHALIALETLEALEGEDSASEQAAAA